MGSAEIERAVKSVGGIHETAAIAVPPLKGGPSRLVIYAVPLPGARVEKEELKAALQAAIRERLSPLFRVHDIVVVDSLPRTASNKVMRRVLRSRYSTELKGG